MGHVDNETPRARATIKAALKLQGRSYEEIGRYFAEEIDKHHVDPKEVLKLAHMGKPKTR